MNYLIVFLGAGIGGALRHGVNVAAARLFGSGLPIGTLGVNVAGSLLMGVLAGYFGVRSGIDEQWKLFFATGVLGGFTTLSAFSLDAALLYERGSYGSFALYVVGSVALSIVALFAGMALVKAGSHL